MIRNNRGKKPFAPVRRHALHLLTMSVLIVLVGCSHLGFKARMRRQETVSLLHGDTLVNLQSRPDVPGSMHLRTVTYNAHLLPMIATPVAGHRGQSSYRASAIATQLHDFDLIGLCEVFHDSHRQTLISQIESQASREFLKVSGPPRSGRHFVNGGLLLLSRFPVIESHTHTYRHASRFLSNGVYSDGFAAKGILHARIKINDSGMMVDCFLTHLESQSSSAREKQITEMCEFISSHAHDTETIVLMGDFNIVATDHAIVEDYARTATSEYQRLMDSLANVRSTFADVGGDQDCGTSDAISNDGGERIDYVFIAPPTFDSPTVRVATESVRNLRLLDRKVHEGSLSDHVAVACDLVISL
ncbi:MAG: endonuclease/exonuclease/phosphatase family protein [Pirellulaceae bacterium]